GPKMMAVPDAIAGPGEVLVRVGAASVNAVDVAVAAGYMKDFMPYQFPAVIGGDLAGRVEAVGDGVEDFEVGARVFGMMGMKGAIHDGSFGELANPTAASIASAPEGLSDPEAGSPGGARATAEGAGGAVGPGGG